MRVIGADPFTLYDKNSGYYYIYSTSNESKNNRTFYIHRSTDLINFEFVDYIDITDAKELNNFIEKSQLIKMNIMHFLMRFKM